MKPATIHYGSPQCHFTYLKEWRKVSRYVRQTSDRPLAKLVFWSIRTTVCPEAYIDMRIEPGKEFT